MLYLKPFLIALILVALLVPLIGWLARKLGLVGPAGGRHIHKKRIPRLGGLAIIIVFVLTIFLIPELVIEKPLKGVLIAALVILLVGIWDDLKELGSVLQFFWQLVVALIIILAGVRVDYLKNPFGGAIRLDGWQVDWQLFNFHFYLPVLGSLFIILWLVGMINVMNWLDGIDGLAGGVGVIGAFTLFFLSISPLVNQPPIAILAVILAGATLGFLIWNFHPAKIFMGTSGSMFLGFMLGTLAIFSGGKVATALLVMGFPILDALWVVGQRIKNKVSPFRGDRRHLHHKLLELGLSQRQVVLFLYFVSASFGVVALSIQSLGKLIALIILGGLMLTVALIITWLYKRRVPKKI
ncbi:MAG TPA: undecaprenyl/decaprenyl-phosphate alpha-N-acetylglucosaminyl 1-phosphate transferase [Candidatus Portnoybacteria bacterium]|nr:undecaprenyl/decaprenyl-phosphate alpha-N-acetylglucosaminyl 1-phosphate transferase [Candidatus Portnoybacteria bacterium]